MKLKSKLFTSAVAFTMVLSMVAVPAAAQTTAELTAQINSLLAMIAQLQAQIAGGAGATAATTFTTDLTVGSKGAEVTALQQFLVSKGFLTMPAGVAMGYFGALTKTALAAYQTSVGITPAAGYFGPITRAKINAVAVVPVTPGTTTPGSTGITTPGAEGTLSVSTNNSGLVSTVYEGDDMVAIYGFNVEAKNSDIAIQRIKVDLGSDSIIYNKGYSKLYVTVDGNTLASVDLNSSTVVKESGEYYVTIAGFNYVVPKGAKKQVILKADVMSSIDSTDMDGSADSLDVVSVTIPVNGVRGVDGAGIDQYGPSSAALTGRTTAFSESLSEAATLKVSLNNSSPKKAEVVASSGSNENELDKLTLMVFDLKAEKDAVTVDDMRIGVTKSTGNAVAQTAYLFDGSTELDNASIANGMASFTDLGLVVPKDSTKTLTVKIDVRSADGTATPFIGTASTTISADLLSENSQGDSVTESGSATGYAISVRDAGLEITLVSKSISASAPQVGGTNAPSTSTLTATFNVKVKAVGEDAILGTAASTTYPFFEDNFVLGAGNAEPSFKVYRNGAVAASVTSAATSTSYTLPSSCTSNGTNSCVLSEGNEISFPITVQLLGRTAAGAPLTSGLYAIQYASARWISSDGVATATFMDGEADWRTSDVSFP